jgi:hypothetical protein
LIDWILHELEKQPTRLFYEKELQTQDAQEFARLREDRLLEYVQPDQTSEAYGLNQRMPLTVARIAGQLWGIDEDEPEADPVALQRSDLGKYKLSLERFVDKLREANGLSGARFQLDRRLVLAGEKAVGGRRIAFVFALLDSDRRAESLLLSLPAPLGRRVDTFVVVTPSYVVGSASLGSQLEALRIYVIPFSTAEDLTVDLSALFKEAPVSIALPKLAAQQERDYQLYGYKCRLAIHITGEVTKAGNNVVLVGDTPVGIGDVPFLLFLRLVIGLCQDKIGAVSKVELKSEGYLSEDGEFQSIGRLRQCFVRALGGLDPKAFIEGYRPKTLRVSVHPHLVSWDKRKLVAHDNFRVRGLAEQLPG